MRFIPLIILIAGLLFACSTVPTDIPQNLKPEEYFQKAQAAVVDRSDYRTALAYYEAYLERFGDDIQLTVEAEYEIAFIYYKLHEYEVSREKFEQLIAKYRADNANLLPQWPLILANKVVAEIDQIEAATAAK